MMPEFNQPRVTAQYGFDGMEERTYSGDRRATPEVDITVKFDIGDHEAASRYLETAVAKVKAQITKAAK